MVSHKAEIERTARGVLAKHGVSYGATMEMGIFDFPIRSYGSTVVPAGKYEAVRILLGEAKGQNWWCVLFPPLCLVDATTAVAAPLPEGEEETGSGDQIQLRWKLLEMWKQRRNSGSEMQATTQIAE